MTIRKRDRMRHSSSWPDRAARTVRMRVDPLSRAFTIVPTSREALRRSARTAPRLDYAEEIVLVDRRASGKIATIKRTSLDGDPHERVADLATEDSTIGASNQSARNHERYLVSRSLSASEAIHHRESSNIASEGSALRSQSRCKSDSLVKTGEAKRDARCIDRASFARRVTSDSNALTLLTKPRDSNALLVHEPSSIAGTDGVERTDDSRAQENGTKKKRAASPPQIEVIDYDDYVTSVAASSSRWDHHACSKCTSESVLRLQIDPFRSPSSSERNNTTTANARRRAHASAPFLFGRGKIERAKRPNEETTNEVATGKKPTRSRNASSPTRPADLRKEATLRRHYYPEGGWGYVVVTCSVLVHFLGVGLQLAAPGVWHITAELKFRHPPLHSAAKRYGSQGHILRRGSHEFEKRSAKMNRRTDSASVSREAAYRKRRRSYYAAMNDETSLDDVPEEEIYSRDDGNGNDDDNCGDEGGEAAAATRSPYCQQRECNARKVSSSESGSWSIDSLVFKRELTRAYSGDTARSWSELEIPELLLAHPEILARATRCRCSVLAQLLATCRCAWCQHQRRKISSASSSCFAREPANARDARRKDSGHSVSTCQSSLPPLLSCDGNSIGSLCHGCTVVDHVGDNARAIQRRHSIAAVNPIGQSRRRYSADQTHSPCGRKIDHADNRRLSEQLTLVDAIGNREGINGDGDASIAKSIIATARSRAHPRTTSGLATQAVAASFRREGSMAPRADIKKPRSDDEITDARLTNGGRHTETRTRRRSSVISPITPQMMRRRFSEQLILEGGLGSVGESENLTGRSGDEEAKEREEQEDESLTAINARKRITLKRHYYPEGNWGYVIVVIAILVRLICHGLQLSSGLLMNPAMVQFQQTAGNSGTARARNVGRLLAFDSRES